MPYSSSCDMAVAVLSLTVVMVEMPENRGCARKSEERCEARSLLQDVQF